MSKAPRCLEKTFVAHLESLKPIMDWLRVHGRDSGFLEAQWNKIEVAIEEVLVNIIRYAYPDHKGWIFFSCHMIPDKQIEFVIKDMGKPFNPAKENRPIPDDIPLEDRKEGGLGLFLMKAYMDEVRYERVDPYNILTLIKKCS